MNQINNFADDDKANDLKLPNYKYREIYYSQKLSKNFKRKTLSIFRINVCSLTKNFNDFDITLNYLIVNFDIFAVTESPIKKDSSSSITLQLDNFSIEHAPTDLLAGGTLLYIIKRLFCQLRSDLKLYHQGKIY